MFPTNPEPFKDLDTHFFRVRRTVMGILMALVFVQWAFIASIPNLVEAALNATTIGLTAFLLVMMGAVMVFRSRLVQALLLAALSLRYLLIYLL